MPRRKRETLPPLPPIRPIGDRIVRIVVVAVTAVTLLIGSSVLAYMFFEERIEARQHLSVQADLMVIQSTPALLFSDRDALRDTLGALKYIDSVQWASVVRNGRELAHYGGVPADFVATRARLDTPPGAAADLIEAETVLESLDALVMRKTISDGGVHLGDLYLATSFRRYNEGFLKIAGVFVALCLLTVSAVLPTVLRLVRQITDPIKELAEVAKTIAATPSSPRRVTDHGADEIGLLARTFNSMLDAQAETQRTLQSLNTESNKIREEERTRIAREIHDELGQLITRLKFDASWIRQHAEQAQEVAARSKEMSDTLDHSLQSVRRISWALRPGILDTAGLPAALEWLGREFSRRTGIPSTVDVDAVKVTEDPDVTINVFRITQELLTNVARHSRARQATVVLFEGGDELTLIVEDDGDGLAAHRDHIAGLGLKGVGERTRALNGRVDIVTRPDFAGTSITVRIPSPANPQKE